MILGAQRSTKILGIFARLDRRDRKPQYLQHLPRVWRYLMSAFAHPALAELKAWYLANVPAPEMPATAAAPLDEDMADSEAYLEQEFAFETDSGQASESEPQAEAEELTAATPEEADQTAASDTPESTSQS
jgi:hypothetical protein